MKISKHRVRTKLWRLEATVAVLKYILDKGEATIAELKCYVHIPPDAISRTLLRRLHESSKRKWTRSCVASDLLSQVIFDFPSRGFLQKEKLGRSNLYRKTSLTEQALQNYINVLDEYQKKEGSND